MDFLEQQFLAISNKLRKGLKELRNLAQKQTEATEEATRADRQAAPSPPVLSAQLQVPDALVDRIITGTRPNEEREEFKVNVEALTFITVLIYAVITGFTWYDLHTQLINQSAAVDGANATAIASIQIAKQQLKLAQLERRSVVRITADPDFVFRPEVPIATMFHIANIGKSFATNVESFVRVEVLRKAESPDFDYTPGHPRTGVKVSVMFPGSTDIKDLPGRAFKEHATLLTLPKFPERLKWTAPLLREMTAGDRYIVVSGTATYEDVFGSHWTHFCAYLFYPSVDRRTVQDAAGPKECLAYNAIDTQ